jgi:hypothetical protein
MTERCVTSALHTDSTNCRTLRSSSGFLYLTKIELNRRRTAKYQDRHLDFTLIVIYLFNDSVKVVERAIDDSDHFSGLKQSLGTWFIGPFFDTSLHEFAHALFDMHELPVLGREEDAADRVAAYIYLQLGKEEARRLITGTAYAHFTGAKSDDSAQTVKEFSEDFAEEHSTPEQRAYNVLCIAYGADPKLFGDVVTNGYLPKERAETCPEEYEQVQDAYETLIEPHIDNDLKDKILDKTWLRKPTAQR